ncbi:unnamed protein product [Gadus morhua 'NCC']
MTSPNKDICCSLRRQENEKVFLEAPGAAHLIGLLCCKAPPTNGGETPAASFMPRESSRCSLHAPGVLPLLPSCPGSPSAAPFMSRDSSFPAYCTRLIGEHQLLR